MDLVVSLDMTKTADGNRIARVHLRKEFAERAEIQLNTHTMDGSASRSVALSFLTHLIVQP